MGIFQNLFKKAEPKASGMNGGLATLSELGSFRASFSAFGADIYQSDDVRTCIRALSEHTSKANPRCTDKRIERMLQYRPNRFMNGKDFLAKLRNILEVKNTAFAYIDRNEKGQVTSIYPVPYLSFEAMEYKDHLFVKFTFAGNALRQLVLPWEDLIVLRKDYVFSDIGGENNAPILNTLDVIGTMDKGLQNAVKSTANLRGILKSTKGMLSPETLRQQKELFVRDYMNIENEGGIASLDASQDFKEINLKPTTASAEEAAAYRERVYRYFGISEKIVKSAYTESDYDAFYEARIEPFLVALSLELTYKIFTERELAFGAECWYEANRLQFVSVKTKISMAALVDRALITPNEYREIFNLEPYEGGDEFVLRLDTPKSGDSTNDDGTGNPVGRPPMDDTEEGDTENGN